MFSGVAFCKNKKQSKGMCFFCTCIMLYFPVDDSVNSGVFNLSYKCNKRSGHCSWMKFLRVYIFGFFCEETSSKNCGPVSVREGMHIILQAILCIELVVFFETMYVILIIYVCRQYTLIGQ